MADVNHLRVMARRRGLYVVVDPHFSNQTRYIWLGRFVAARETVIKKTRALFPAWWAQHVVPLLAASDSIAAAVKV